MADEQELGATWADFGIAIVDFARNDTIIFLLVVSFFTGLIWLLFPQATKMLRLAHETGLLDYFREQKKQGKLPLSKPKDGEP